MRCLRLLVLALLAAASLDAAGGQGRPRHAAAPTRELAAGNGRWLPSSPGVVRVAQGGPKLAGANDEERARSFFAALGGRFGPADPTRELVLRETRRDRLGMTHLRFEQLYRGIPVFAAEVRAHFDRDRELVAVSGAVVAGIAVDPRPAIGEQAAAEIARQAVAKGRAREPWQLDAAVPELVVHNSGHLRGRTGTSRLAWKTEVEDGLGLRELVLVDAHSGAVLERFDLVRRISRRIHHRRYPNPIWLEGNPLPFGALSPAQNAEVNELIAATGDAHQLFRNLSGGDFLGPDRSDGTMHVVYEAQSLECPNATWDGRTTNFCAGLATDDVTAHEWTHAYTDATHDLVYAWQPGALNESFSDIFGEVADLLNERGLDAPDRARTAGECSIFGGSSGPRLEVESPPTVAGTYDAAGATFNPPGPWSVSGLVEPADDGVGTARDACEPLLGFTPGRIALVDRGSCLFVDKARHAADAGAVGVIVANHEGDTLLTMGGDAPPGYATPAIFVTRSAGDRLRAVAGVTATVSLTAPRDDSVRWLVAEGSAGGAFRDMWRPACFGDPARVSDPYYACGEDDSGGVHSNSGISNRAFSLLADGGSFNGVSVAALGLTKAAHIYWRAMETYQGPATGFTDHAGLLELACADLVGTVLGDLISGQSSGTVLSSADCEQVSLAMTAVEMRRQPEQCRFEPILAPNPPAAGPSSTVYEEPFDTPAAAGSWTLSSQGVNGEYRPQSWRHTTELPAGRAGGALHAVNSSAIGNCVVGSDDQSGVVRAESPVIQLPGSARSALLIIDHYLASEPGWDGGNLKLSVNGGDYELVPESAFRFNPYNASVISSLEVDGRVTTNSNPLAGEPAFTGVDQGQIAGSWGQSQVDLLRLAKPGDAIRLRLDFGVDGCTGVEGWFIDRLAVLVGGRPEPALLRPGGRVRP
jgi:Zn-dependent metalloprotease